MPLADKPSFFGRMAQRIGDAIMLRPTIDEETVDEIEEILVSSDIGVDTTMKITEELRDSVRHDRLRTREELMESLTDIIAGMLDKGERHAVTDETPLILMLIGVNGVGKTTTIAKLAHRYKEQGKSVMLIAADTFRAAAAEQLVSWSGILDVPVIMHKEGADPSAVIFDGLNAAKSRGTDVIICDTAGRLHNKKNLMNELSKMDRVIERGYPEAARENLLVLDATTGKNAISQAAEFSQAAKLDGVILTKMDGTAKGGIVVTLADMYDLAVKFIGVGEGMSDLREFDPKAFAESIFEGSELNG
ncbi:MAG: signal recognition particle-docking protein FtsY [Firmicutes bacterium]|nr:signal recognition particle-docking protein FtsY [Bacillota bacterium]MBQ2059388.1 signal recognition particle-docking protein FtsY [Bacillota bacterium]